MNGGFHRRRLVRVPLIASAALAAAAGLASASPVLYYPLEGSTDSATTIYDQSGNGCSATTVSENFGATPNPVTFPSDVPSSISGHSTTSINLGSVVTNMGTATTGTDSGGNYIQSSYAGIGGTAARTVTMWIKTPNLTSNASSEGEYSTLFSYGNDNGSTAGARFEIRLDGANNANGTIDPMRFEVQGAATVFNAAGDVNVTDGNWHFIALVVPANSTLAGVSMYIDDTLQTAGTSTSPTTALNTDTTDGNATDIRIGQTIVPANVIASHLFVGEIDDVAMFNTALTSSQITALYEGASPLSVPEPASLGIVGAAGAIALLRRRRRR